MAGIDNRIVTMKFDNAQFESGARTSLSTLEKLKQSMNFGTVGTAASKALGGISGLFAKFGIKNPFATAEKGAADLGKTAQGTINGLSSIDGAVTGVSARFVALSTIAITALSNIANSAFSAGAAVAKGLTVDPVKTGLSEYETNLNSIQTILANTKVSGATLEDVNAALDELNHYSDTTIYNFSEMAKNIGTFTAAGVGLDESVQSIKGIANLAALSGSNSQQAATAMYQLSQEIAAGRVSLMGWNSVVNAGMGGSIFQRALAQTAVAMGEIDQDAIKLQGEMKNVTINGQSFRDSIMAKPGEVSWLTKEVLTGTLAQFTNDMSKAQIMAQGFNESQAESIMATARTAQAAAQDVKTLSGVFDVAKETAASGWSRTWQLIFGDFKEAKTLFTNVSTAFSGMIAKMAEKRNELLEGWDKLGGRDKLIKGFEELFKSIFDLLAPIKDAFRDIFPAMKPKELVDLTQSFVDFAKGLSISKETADGLRQTFQGVFAIFSIIGKVISAVASGISQLFSEIGKGSGGILNFTGGIADLIVKFNNFLERTGVLEAFFRGLGSLLSVPLKIIGGFASMLSNMFSGFDSGAAERVGDGINALSEKGEQLQSVGERIMDVFQRVGQAIATAADYIGEKLATLGDLIAGAITPETFSKSLDVINTTLLGGIFLMIRKFFTGGLNIDLSGGLFDGIKETLGAATGALQNMQASLKADILLKIAAALAILTASLVVLAMIDGKSLTKAMVGISVGFGVLGGALLILSNAFNILGAAKLPFIAAGMIGLAIAILALAGALKVMASIDVLDMLQGLAGIAALLFIIQKAMKLLTASSAGIVRVGAALVLLGVGLNLMAISLKILATMSWEEMAKGLLGVAGALVIIAGAMKIMPTGIVLQAAAILILSAALNAMGLALKIFASMSWEEMAKGLVTLAGALVIIAGAMALMPNGVNLTLQAAGLVLVGLALNLMGAALKSMGGMSWEAIAKGLVALGGALLVLAIGLNMMGLMGIFGATALTIAAAALTLLTPVLITLGSLNWETIIKSLVMLAGVFTVLGVAGFLLAPLIPVLLGLALAMLGIGAALALAGAGALAFATAFGIIVATGAAGIEMLAQMLATVIQTIPKIMQAVAQGLVKFAQTIANNGPKFVNAMSRIISNMLDAVIRNVPKMGRAFLVMLNTAIDVVLKAAPRLFAAGLRLIIGFLEAVDSKIGRIVDLAVSITVKFINGLARNMDKIIDAGFNLVIKFIDGLSRAIDNNASEVGRAGGELAVSLVRGVVVGIGNGIDAIRDAAINAAKQALEAAKDWLKIGSPSKRARDEVGQWIPAGIGEGVRAATPALNDEMARMGNSAMSKISEVMQGVDEVFALDPNLNPTISPVLDLTALTREANKMSDILAMAPIMPGVSYQTAADISAMTQASAATDVEADVPGSGGGDTYVTLEQHNHSPKPIDSVETYRGGKTLIGLAKEALK